MNLKKEVEKACKQTVGVVDARLPWNYLYLLRYLTKRFVRLPYILQGGVKPTSKEATAELKQLYTELVVGLTT